MRAFIVIITFMLLPLNVLAQFDNKEIIEHNGKQGVFLDEEVFTRIVQDLAEHKKFKEELIPELNLKIKQLEHLNMTLELDLKYANEMVTHWQDNFYLSEDLRVTETNRLREQLERKGIWYKSPPFMFSVGIIAGGLLSVGIAWGLSNATNGYI